MAIRFDSAALPALRRTAQGFARVDARVARVGVLEYTNADGSKRRELCLPEEVFQQDSLASLDGVPVTIRHSGMVNPDNVRALRMGGQRGTPRQDGDFLATELQLDAKEAIDGAESKDLQEISSGYYCKLEMVPGTWRGQRYDAIQRDRRYNHIALGPKGYGRAGGEVSMRLDGAAEETDIAYGRFDEAIITCDKSDSADIGAQSDQGVRMKFGNVELKLDEKDAAVIAAHLGTLEGKIATLEAAAGKSAGEQASTKVRLDAAEARCAKIDRDSLEAGARAVLGKDEKFDGKKDDEIRAAVIAKVYPTLRLDGQSGEYVKALFDAAVAAPAVKEVVKPVTPTGVTLQQIVREDGAPKKSERELMVERRRNAALKKVEGNGK